MAGGLGALLWGGMLSLGGWWASGHAFRQPDGLPRAIGAAVLAWVWATLGALALGLFGSLARGPLLAWAAAGLALGGLVRALATHPPGRSESRGGPVDRAATVGLALTLWSVVIIGMTSWLVPVKVISDAPIYHLYFAAQWWKSGRLSIVPAPFGDTAVSYLPENGEVLFAALMALANGDGLARAGPFLFLLFGAASAFAIARRVGAGTSSAILAVGLFATSLPVLIYSFEANVNMIFVAGYLAAAYFFLEYAQGDGGAGTLTLGALAAGGTWGSKATGTVFVPPLLVIAAVAVLFRGGSRRTRLGHLLLLALSPWLMAGYWFARNAWVTGNPLYPLQVSILGRVWLPGWFESSAMRHSRFYLPRGDLRILADALLNVFDPRLAPLWAAGLVAAWAPRRERPGSRWDGLVAAMTVANVALYWILIPYRSQQRFLLPAIGLATAPLACLLDRAGWLRWSAVGLLALHLLTPPTWPVTPLGRATRWGFSGGMRSAAQGPVPAIPTLSQWREIQARPALGLDLAVTITSAVLALLAAREWVSGGRDRSPGRWLRAAIATSALIAMPCPFISGYFKGIRAVFPDAALARAWDRLDRLAGPRPARIAYAGTNLVYYLMGRGQRHDVVYVNVDAHRGWRLHDYHREAIARSAPNWPDPRPGWDRLHPDYDAWLANLAAERIDFLFVARPDPIDGRFNIADPYGYPIERVWADAHPEAFTLVYGPEDGEPVARIYRVHPPAPPERARRLSAPIFPEVGRLTRTRSRVEGDTSRGTSERWLLLQETLISWLMARVDRREWDFHPGLPARSLQGPSTTHRHG